MRPGGLFGFLTHNRRGGIRALHLEGRVRVGFIPKGNHDFHKFIRPEDLSKRMAALFDLENPRAVLAETPADSYLGHAIKE